MLINDKYDTKLNEIKNEEVSSCNICRNDNLHITCFLKKDPSPELNTILDFCPF